MVDGKMHQAPGGEQWLVTTVSALYEVSSHGRVRRVGQDTHLRPWFAGDGKAYEYVGLALGNGQRWKGGVHRLVALAFLGPPPSPSHQVAHGDGNSRNNTLANLRWATSAENNADKIQHGTDYRGDRKMRGKHPFTKITVADVESIIAGYAGRRGEAAALARQYGVSHSVVARILRLHGLTSASV